MEGEDPKYLQKYFGNMDENKKLLWSIDSDSGNNKEEQEIKINPSNAETALMPPVPVDENRKDVEVGNRREEATTQGDQRIF